MTATISEQELQRLRYWYEQILTLAAELRNRGVALPEHDQAELDQIGAQLAKLEQPPLRM
jgi:hypothetical protein